MVQGLGERGSGGQGGGVCARRERWRWEVEVALAEGGDEVRGRWRGAREVARESGRNDEDDTLSSAWLPCVQCIHLFKEHCYFPEAFLYSTMGARAVETRPRGAPPLAAVPKPAAPNTQGHTGPHRAIQGHTGPHRATQGHTGPQVWGAAPPAPPDGAASHHHPRALDAVEAPRRLVIGKELAARAAGDTVWP